jgi:hypothetical protein
MVLKEDKWGNLNDCGMRALTDPFWIKTKGVLFLSLFFSILALAGCRHAAVDGRLREGETLAPKGRGSLGFVCRPETRPCEAGFHQTKPIKDSDLFA